MSTMVAIVKRIKQVVKRGAIMPWKTGDKYKAIEKSSDVPTSMFVLRKYLRHEEEKEGRPYKRGFRQGRNAKWRLNINFTQATGDEFLHYWNESKKVYNTSTFVIMKAAAMQAETYYGLGSFVNSSEKQLVDILNEGFTGELGWAVEMTFRDAPAAYGTIDGFWKEAKKIAGNDAKLKYALAPQSLVIHCNASNPAIRAKLVKILFQKYGGHDDLGRYHQCPDGSRMRFVPAENRTPMIQRHKLKTLLATQINLKSIAQNIDFPYTIKRDQIFQGVAKTKGRALGKLILELESNDAKFNNEPIFRHFCFSWSKEYKDYGLAVSVLPVMIPLAVEALRRLPSIMGDMYGDEVANAIQPAVSKWQSQVDRLEPAEDNAHEGWVIDEYDRYGLRGGGNFVITGMTEVEKKTDGSGYSASDNVSLLTPGTGLTERTFGENNHPKAAPVVIDDEEATEEQSQATPENTNHDEDEVVDDRTTHQTGVRQGQQPVEIARREYMRLLKADESEKHREEKKNEEIEKLTEDERAQ